MRKILALVVASLLLAGLFSFSPASATEAPPVEPTPVTETVDPKVDEPAAEEAPTPAPEPVVEETTPEVAQPESEEKPQSKTVKTTTDQHNWTYQVTCSAVSGSRPNKDSVDSNIRIKNLTTGKVQTFNYHGPDNGPSGPFTYTLSSHYKVPSDWKHFEIQWVQVNGTNYHWEGALECGKSTPQPDPKPEICHPVNGKGETGNGWNLIEPNNASSHIDEATGAGKHESKDGRTDVVAVNGKCPDSPVDEEPPFKEYEKVVCWKVVKDSTDGLWPQELVKVGECPRIPVCEDVTYQQDSYTIKDEEDEKRLKALLDSGVLNGSHEDGSLDPEPYVVFTVPGNPDLCPPAVVEYPDPSVTDPCGPDNATWVKPEDSDKVTWTVTDDGRLIGETTKGHVWPNGTTVNSWGTAPDSGVKCPPPSKPENIEFRESVNPPNCEDNTVTTEHQFREEIFTLDEDENVWVGGEFTDWFTFESDTREATLEECPPVVVPPVTDTPPVDVPDEPEVDEPKTDTPVKTFTTASAVLPNTGAGNVVGLVVVGALLLGVGYYLLRRRR